MIEPNSPPSDLLSQALKLSLPCISCGRHHKGQYHAGHYRTVGAHPELRFNEDNCHGQCATCNNHLSGNIRTDFERIRDVYRTKLKDLKESREAA